MTSPLQWPLRRLGDICQTSSGGTPSRVGNGFVGGTIPWIKSGELEDGSIDSAAETITEDALKKSSAKIFPAGVLLIAMYGANVGRLGLLDIPAATNQAICAVFPPSNLDRSFLFYCILHARDWLIGKSTGGAQPNISQEIIRDIEIPFPSIDEQYSVSRKLSSSFEKVSSAALLCRNQLDLATHLQGRFLEDVFGNSNPIVIAPGTQSVSSNDWRWKRLVSMARLESGHTPSRRHPEWWGGDVPWLALPDIRKLHGKYAYETTEYTNDAGLANSAARLLPVGTVCLCRDASVGFVTILGRPMATTQHFANWICDPEKLDSEFLMYAFMASHDYLRGLGSGSVIKTIYMPTIESFHVCAPAIDEQRRIARMLRERLAATEALNDGLKARLAEIERLPSRLLAAAFGSAG